MELSRYELAAVKKTAQIVKPKRAKLDKIKAKVEALRTEMESLQAEIDLWEAPIVTKHGYSSEQILSGEADTIAAQTEDMGAVDVEQVAEDAPDYGIGNTVPTVAFTEDEYPSKESEF